MTFKLHHAVAALAICACVGAQAAVINVGELSSTAKSGNSLVLGSFSDTLNFSIAPASTAITGFVFDFESFGLGSITSFAATLANTSGGSAAPVLTQVGTSDSYTLGGVLSAGNYALTVSGVASPLGSYGYSLAAIAPVPEPETYALLLAGLGLIAGVARRRV